MRSGGPRGHADPKLGRPYVSIGFPSGPRICTSLTRSCGFALATPGTAATRSTSVDWKVAGRSVPASIGVTGVTVTSAVLVVKFFFRAAERVSVKTIAPPANAMPSRTATVHSTKRSRCARTERRPSLSISRPPRGRASSWCRARSRRSGRAARIEAAVGQEQHAVGVRGRVGSWVTMTTVWPKSRTDRCRKPSTSADERESRLPVGSSANTTSGRATSARAHATRCCWPPDSSDGLWLRRSGRPIVSITVSSHSWSGLRPAISTGSVMFSSAVRVGTRLNAWNTNPIRSRRRWVSCFSGIRVRSTSPRKICPAVGLSRPARQCSRVDFPDPEGP